MPVQGEAVRHDALDILQDLQLSAKDIEETDLRQSILDSVDTALGAIAEAQALSGCGPGLPVIFVGRINDPTVRRSHSDNVKPMIERGLQPGFVPENQEEMWRKVFRAIVTLNGGMPSVVEKEEETGWREVGEELVRTGSVRQARECIEGRIENPVIRAVAHAKMAEIHVEGQLISAQE